MPHTSPEAGPIISGTSSIWKDYFKYGVKQDYKANMTLLHAGEVTKYVYYLQKGEVLISNFTSPDSVNRLFIIREQSILGLVSMFSPNASMATWVTLKPCTCYLFDTESVYKRMPRELLLNMLEQLAAMNMAMSRRFSHGNLKCLEVRLARLVIHLVDSCAQPEQRDKNSIVISPNITQEMASELLGMHPVTLNKLLGTFRSKGILGRFTKNKLEIFDMESLLKVADGVLRF